MPILIISANLLFIEAISESLCARLGFEPLSASPEQALERAHEVQADVLLVDEAIPPQLLKEILKQPQNLARTRLILLNSTCNDFIVLDAYRSEIGNVDDLVESIRSQGKQPSSGRASSLTKKSSHEG